MKKRRKHKNIQQKSSKYIYIYIYLKIRSNKRSLLFVKKRPTKIAGKAAEPSPGSMLGSCLKMVSSRAPALSDSFRFCRVILILAVWVWLKISWKIWLKNPNRWEVWWLKPCWRWRTLYKNIKTQKIYNIIRAHDSSDKHCILPLQLRFKAKMANMP